MRDATLHIIGTGPGDPELLTLKALKTLTACPVIAAPKASPSGSSTALAIISQAVDLDGKTVFELYFPMKKIRAGKAPEEEVSRAWRAAGGHDHRLSRPGTRCRLPNARRPGDLLHRLLSL